MEEPYGDVRDLLVALPAESVQYEFGEHETKNGLAVFRRV